MRYDIDYENWSKEDLKELGDLLNTLMTLLNRTIANDDEERSWLRRFENDMDNLIDKVGKKVDT